MVYKDLVPIQCRVHIRIKVFVKHPHQHKKLAFVRKQGTYQGTRISSRKGQS